MTVAVAPFDGAAAEWDALVAGDARSTFCHRHDWRQVIEETFGHECLWLAARGPDATLEGVLPLVRVKSFLFGHFLVSLPFLNYGGPLGSGRAGGALARAAAVRAERDQVRLLELRSRSPLDVELAPSHHKITVVLDLPDTADALMASFPSKLRSQVRRPFKEGLEVRFGADQIDPFYAVFSRHMRDLGTPVMPRRFFEAAGRAFGDDAWFGCAWLGDRPVACGAGFRWRDEVEITWASSLAEFNRIAANMGLYWGFMTRAIDLGLARFNFGRCTPGGGTHRFKTQWGGRDEPLWWYQLAPGGRPAHAPTPDDARYAWGPRMWKRLPLGVANRLGPRIVRSIP